MSWPKSSKWAWPLTKFFSPSSPWWLSQSTLRDSLEDTHELLGEHELQDPLLVAKWAQPKSQSVFRSFLCNTRAWVFYAVFVTGLVVGLIALFATARGEPEPPGPHFPWDDFRRLDGFYQGINKLVRLEDFVPQNVNALLGGSLSNHSAEPLTALLRDRSSDFTLAAYLPPLRKPKNTNIAHREQCYLRNNDTIPAPVIYAVNGLPQHGVVPVFGSYDALELRQDVCFERYGRYGPYGLGYAVKERGSGLGLHGDQSMTDSVWEVSGYLNWSSFDLGEAQQRCFDRNKHLYPQTNQSEGAENGLPSKEAGDIDWQQHRPLADESGKLARTAVVLRAWQGVKYKPADKMYIRSLVNELSLQSGGEYQVHLLVEVKDEEQQIWNNKTAYDEVLADSVPEEFRSMATLWSQGLMQQMYPGPFEPQFSFHGSMYPAMRSMHFALQWFMLQHPEYEYFWNWEMDIRYIGHWYELMNGVSAWAKKQPRSHLWARNARYYIPALYENWEAFLHDTRARSPVDIITREEFKPNPTPGHENDDEEEADFITFNPIFDPNNTEWNRRDDVTGYDTSQPIPERRTAIVAASRLSRRLLLAMHHENRDNHHSMASEMFPPTMALHHGLKAVYVPHPVYLERDWPAEYAFEIFNGGPAGDTGNFIDSVFGESPQSHQYALYQSTYFYNAKFAEFLWWRWLGYQDYRYRNEGGARDELKKDKSGFRKGRMCLRSTLLHPVKYDEGRSI